MPDHTFDTAEPVDLDIRIPTGTVTVTAADTGTSTVSVTAIDDDGRDLAEKTRVRFSAGRLTVEAPERRLGVRRRRIAVEVTVPSGSTLQVRVAAAQVTATGRYAAATVHTASGQIEVERVDGDAEVHCASGDVTLGTARAVAAHTSSGKVRIGHATGEVDVHCASGAVRIGVAETSVRVRTASGDVTIDEASTGTVRLNVTSGDLRIGVRSGVTARLDLRSVSGRVRSELPVEDVAPTGGAPLDLQARAVSGNIVVVPAPAPAGA